MKGELKYAFPKTVPVMVGYLFLGAAYGILMEVNGFGVGWVLAMSMFVYAGSLQYVGVTLLAAAVHPLYAFAMGLMINARHLFYGISILNKYKGLGRWKPYLIFALTDETFSVLCNEDGQKGLDRERIYLWIALLDHLYWIAGSVMGVILGSMITFDTKGLDFALTALFVVIFTEQWKHNGNHKAALLGVLASFACLLIFGADIFIIPSMVVILAALTWQYGRKEERA